LVQQGLGADPFDGAVYAFRGRRAGLMKLIWHDGIGLCMLTKRLEQGQFAWPSATSTGRIALSAANWRRCSTAANGGLRWRGLARSWRAERAHFPLGATRSRCSVSFRVN
jgi:transposase